MKHIALFITTMLCSLACWACGDDADEPAQPASADIAIGTFDDVKVPFKDNTATFDYNGGQINFRVRSNAAWTIASDAEWATVNKTGGDATNVVGNALVLTVAKHTSPETRTATIKVVSGDETKSLTVSQTGMNSVGPMGVAQWMGLGWNLGNQFDAWSGSVGSEMSGETVWGNKACTQETFNKVKAAGFSTVRIPVTWMGHVGDAPKYTIEEAWLNRVAEVVGYCENAGLNAIVNIHHDGADGAHWLNIKGAANSAFTNDNVKAKIAAIWSQIAKKFKDKGEFLIFESFNEIQDGGWGWGDNTKDGGKQYKTLNEWNQLFVNTVRAAGGKNVDRYLGVPGYSTNADLTMQNLVVPTDEIGPKGRIMVAYHNYDPYNYTLECKYNTWPCSDGNEASLRNGMQKMFEKYVNQGIPVYIGEFGNSKRASASEIDVACYYLQYFTRCAREYGMAPIFWDNGNAGTGKESSAIFNHATGEYLNDQSRKFGEAMVSGWTTEKTLDQIKKK